MILSKRFIVSQLICALGTESPKQGLGTAKEGSPYARETALALSLSSIALIGNSLYFLIIVCVYVLKGLGSYKFLYKRFKFLSIFATDLETVGSGETPSNSLICRGLYSLIRR